MHLFTSGAESNHENGTLFKQGCTATRKQCRFLLLIKEKHFIEDEFPYCSVPDLRQRRPVVAAHCPFFDLHTNP